MRSRVTRRAEEIPPFDRPRSTERAVLSAFERSGKPVRAFAAEHGLDAQRVYLWRRRLGEAERA